MNLHNPLDRRGLTLLELVVVLTILVALAGLAIPLLGGLSTQADGSTNAAVVGDVDRAVGTYFTRHDAHADGWDSLLNSSDTLFTKLRPALTSTTVPNGAPDPTLPILAVSAQTLSKEQAESLKDAGIDVLYDADETAGRSPNAAGSTVRTVDPQAGVKYARLNIPGNGAVLGLEAFGIGAANAELTSARFDFLVVGLGGNTSIKGETLMDVPLVLSAEPTKNYARVLCVFAIPAASSTATFRARYLGCFLPDGTTLRHNLDRYESARSN